MTIEIDNQTVRILAVDDNPDILRGTVRVLKSAGYDVFEASSGRECLELTARHEPELILLDVMLGDTTGTEVCEKIKSSPDLKQPFIILLSSLLTSSGEQAHALEGGADGYIARPVSNRELLARLQSMVRIKRAEEALQQAHDELERRVAERTADLARANEELLREIEERKRAEENLQKALTEIEKLKERLHKENIYLREEIKLDHNYDEITGQSDALKYVLFKVEQVAPTNATVLVMGETGTGKELIARAIHHGSPRRERPLVKLNCATLPANLIESELFGHESGAFTGAQKKHIGRFELADNGTIFLDEVGELPLELQPKLLRVLQDGEFERLGSSRTIRVDVRVIAATNRKLSDEVAAARFREDLWYRLNVFPVTLPPLRRRREDIPLLVNMFVNRFAKKIGRKIDKIPSEVMKALRQYRWPGNVRELENVIERAVIVSAGPLLMVEMPNTRESSEMGDLSLEAMEREHLNRVLESTGWVIEGKKGAASVLGLNPGTLRSKLKKLGIHRPS